MVDKVARLHFQPASPAGALRALSGWLIALTGLALLAAQLVRSVDGFEAHPVSLGRRDGGYVEITTGLQAGVEVAASGSFTLKSELGKATAEHSH